CYCNCYVRSSAIAGDQCEFVVETSGERTDPDNVCPRRKTEGQPLDCRRSRTEREQVRIVERRFLLVHSRIEQIQVEVARARHGFEKDKDGSRLVDRELVQVFDWIRAAVGQLHLELTRIAVRRASAQHYGQGELLRFCSLLVWLALVGHRRSRGADAVEDDVDAFGELSGSHRHRDKRRGTVRRAVWSVVVLFGKWKRE